MAQDFKEKYINPVYRDINNAINTAKAEAKAEGIAEGKAEGIAEGKAEANRDIARKMKDRGFSAEDIADVTGLNVEEIKAF